MVVVRFILSYSLLFISFSFIARGAVEGGGMPAIGSKINAGCLVEVAGAAIIREPEPSELDSAKYVTCGIFVSITGSVVSCLRFLGGFAWRDIDLFSYKNVSELSFSALCRALIAPSARLEFSAGNSLLIRLFVALVSTINLPFSRTFSAGFLFDGG